MKCQWKLTRETLITRVWLFLNSANMSPKRAPKRSGLYWKQVWLILLQAVMCFPCCITECLSRNSGSIEHWLTLTWQTLRKFILAALRDGKIAFQNPNDYTEAVHPSTNWSAQGRARRQYPYGRDITTTNLKYQGNWRNSLVNPTPSQRWS